MARTHLQVCRRAPMSRGSRKAAILGSRSRSSPPADRLPSMPAKHTYIFLYSWFTHAPRLGCSKPGMGGRPLPLFCVLAQAPERAAGVRRARGLEF